MKDQLQVAIFAMLAAKHEISRLKEEFEASDARWIAVDDAESGAAWIVRKLSSLGQPAAGPSPSGCEDRRALSQAKRADVTTGSPR